MGIPHWFRIMGEYMATILELEAIQRRFTRLANDIGLLPYSGRLAKNEVDYTWRKKIKR